MSRLATQRNTVLTTAMILLTYGGAAAGSQPDDETSGRSTGSDAFGAGGGPQNFSGSGVSDGGVNGHMAASTGYITPWSEVVNKTPATNCIDIQGNSSANGTRAQVYSCSGGANQGWVLQSITTGNYLVGIDGKCLATTFSGDPPNGSPVVLEPCTGNGAAWVWNESADNTIRTLVGNSCLTKNSSGLLEVDTCTSGHRRILRAGPVRAIDPWPRIQSQGAGRPGVQ
jgi:hypothetical protein